MTSIKEFGLQVIKVSGGQELLLCPFHVDRKPSAWWSPKKNLFWCAVCNLGLNEVQLRQRLHLEIGDIGGSSYELEDFNLISEVVELPRGEVKETAYTRSRRISYSTLAAYDVQATADSIIFPFTDLRGKVTGTMSRYTDPEKVGTRYKIHGKRQPLWPMHWLKEKAAPDQSIVVVEGAWSAMTLYQWDHYFVLSLMGAKAESETLEIMAVFNVVYLYDNDVAGRNACKKMRRLGAEHAYVLPVAPDDMSVEQLEELTGKLDKLWRRE